MNAMSQEDLLSLKEFERGMLPERDKGWFLTVTALITKIK